MRKYIFNGKIIGAAVGAFTTVQATRRGPRDWRLLLLWLGWAISVAGAVGDVLEDAKEQRELER